MAGLNAPAAPAWDRYGHWPRGQARLALALLIALLVLAAWAPGMKSGPAEVPLVSQQVSSAPQVTPAAKQGERDNDLRFYQLVNQRVAQGDNYYVAATELQRANGYPVAPGLTVRLPTLAYLFATFGQTGMRVLALLLVGAAVFANWRRFGSEPGGEAFRLIGSGLLFVGLSNALNAQFLVLHEVWSGGLIALSIGLHRAPSVDGRGGKWLAALAAAAAALAIRELALPFVVLMAALAVSRRQWREAGAWGALMAVFLAVLAWHISLAEAQIRPGDAVSPSWLALSGLSGALYKVIHSSVLSLLPQVLAGPLVILALLGWSGWKSAMGSLASLTTLGYTAAFMVAGRDNNFYWGVIIVPVLLMGLALAPFAAKALWGRAVSLGQALA